MTDHQGIFAGDCHADGRIVFDVPKAVTAYCRRKFAGQRVDVEIRLRKSKRTPDQNAAFHAGLQAWAVACGVSDVARWVEDMKDDLLGLTFGYVVRQNQLTGEISKRLIEPSTAKLTVEQFSELFDVAIVQAAERGHVWTLPDEIAAAVKKRKAAHRAA